MKVGGTTVYVGDDVDTDVMYPGRYLSVLEPSEQAKYLFEPLGPELRTRLSEGGVLVGGWNLGCGSSREHAVTSLIGVGTRLVIAKSFARIFFRNMVNNGLPAVASEELACALSDGAQVSVDLQNGIAIANGTEIAFTPLSAELLEIVMAGGLWRRNKEKAE